MERLYNLRSLIGVVFIGVSLAFLGGSFYVLRIQIHELTKELERVGQVKGIAAVKQNAHGNIEKEDEYLSQISEFIHSTNEGKNEYKQDVADRLERIGYKSHKNE